MQACKNPSPVIDGRRANCNLASLGANKNRPPLTTPQLGLIPSLSIFYFHIIIFSFSEKFQSHNKQVMLIIIPHSSHLFWSMLDTYYCFLFLIPCHLWPLIKGRGRFRSSSASGLIGLPATYHGSSSTIFKHPTSQYTFQYSPYRWTYHLYR